MKDTQIDHMMKKYSEATRDSSIPPAVRLRIDLTLDSLPDSPNVKTEKTVTKWGASKKAAFTAAVTFLLIGAVIVSGFVSPVAAAALKHIPFLANVFEFAGDTGLKKASEKGLASTVNVSATDQGITLTFTDVIYDGLRLALAYTEQSDTGLPPIDRGDHRFNFGVIEHNGWWNSRTNYSSIDENLQAGVVDFEWIHDKQSPPDRFNLKLEVRQIGNVKGSWKFSIPIEKSKSEVKKLIPMITKETDVGKITIKSVSISASGTEIKFDSYYKKARMGLNTNYLLIDDKGQSLAALSASATGGPVLKNGLQIFEHTSLYEPLHDQNAKYLILKPYTGGVHKGDTQAKLGVLPVTVKQGEIGTVTVTKIERFVDKTIMHYDIVGDDPLGQAGPVWLLDSQGKLVKDDEKFPKLVRYDNGKYSFVREYPPVKPDEPIKLYTRSIEKLDFYEDLEIVVPLE